MREVPRLHRKQWEFCYILQALSQAGMLRFGARGLGFGVGKEPLVAVLAARGCCVVATDMDPAIATEIGWVASNQHAASLAHLNERGSCPPDIFAEQTSFRVVDMNHVPDELVGFDFIWSSCALEHLGTLEHGLNFVRRSLDCLNPGGVAVHTTEFNVGSNDVTVSEGGTVLYRRCDIETLADDLTAAGHIINLNLHPGDGQLDQHIDVPPYSESLHLKLQLGAFVTTSLGLIIRKAA
jgi:hypothetical protein